MLLIAASILAARKLAQYDGGKRVPAAIAQSRMQFDGQKRSCGRLIGAGLWHESELASLVRIKNMAFVLNGLPHTRMRYVIVVALTAERIAAAL